MQVYDPFWVNFHAWCEVRDQFHSYACRYPVVSAPYAEETIPLAPLLKTNWSKMYGLFLDSQSLLQDFCRCLFFTWKALFHQDCLLTPIHLHIKAHRSLPQIFSKSYRLGQIHLLYVSICLAQCLIFWFKVPNVYTKMFSLTVCNGFWFF